MSVCTGFLSFLRLRLKFYQYFSNADTSPVILQHAVWFNISTHFNSCRSLSFYQHLRQDSFEFQFDRDRTEYACLTLEARQKIYHAGLTKDEALCDRRMYATRTRSCPVGLLKLLKAKTNPAAEFLFNTCDKVALSLPSSTSLWFTNSPLGPKPFGTMMSDISMYAQTRGIYNMPNLRATIRYHLKYLHLSTRDSRFMSGRRNENPVPSNSLDQSAAEWRKNAVQWTPLTGGRFATTKCKLPKQLAVKQLLAKTV